MSFIKKNQKIKIPKEYEGSKLRRLSRNNIDNDFLQNNINTIEQPNNNDDFYKSKRFPDNRTKNILENNINNDAIKDIYKPIYIPNITRSNQKNLPMYPEFLNKSKIDNNRNINQKKNSLSRFYKSTITNELTGNFHDLREILLSIDPKLIGCPIIATDSVYNADNTVNVIITFNKNPK